MMAIKKPKPEDGLNTVDEEDENFYSIVDPKK